MAYTIPHWCSNINRVRSQRKGKKERHERKHKIVQNRVPEGCSSTCPKEERDKIKIGTLIHFRPSALFDLNERKKRTPVKNMAAEKATLIITKKGRQSSKAELC